MKETVEQLANRVKDKRSWLRKGVADLCWAWYEAGLPDDVEVDVYHYDDHQSIPMTPSRTCGHRGKRKWKYRMCATF